MGYINSSSRISNSYPVFILKFTICVRRISACIYVIRRRNWHGYYWSSFVPHRRKKEYLNRSYTLFQDNIFFRRTTIQQNLSHPVQEVTGALPYPPINFLLPGYDLSIDTIFSWITIKIHCKTFHCHFNNKFLNIRVRCLDSRLKSKNTKPICFGCKLYFYFPISYQAIQICVYDHPFPIML